MIRLAAISAVVLLAACELEEEAPKPPSPEMLALMTACQEGNLDACAMVENLRAQREAQRAALAAAWIGANPVQPMQPLTMPPLPPVR